MPWPKLGLALVNPEMPLDRRHHFESRSAIMRVCLDISLQDNFGKTSVAPPYQIKGEVSGIAHDVVHT